MNCKQYEKTYNNIVTYVYEKYADNKYGFLTNLYCVKCILFYNTIEKLKHINRCACHQTFKFTYHLDHEHKIYSGIAGLKFCSLLLHQV